jgi:hypothetical protein
MIIIEKRTNVNLKITKKYLNLINKVLAIVFKFNKILNTLK